MNLLDLVDLGLNQTKLTDITKINVSEKFMFSDWFVIANATSKQQAKTSAKKISNILLKFDIQSKIEGLNSDSWILIDAGNCIIHIFINEYRSHYDLESLWSI